MPSGVPPLLSPSGSKLAAPRQAWHRNCIIFSDFQRDHFLRRFHVNVFFLFFCFFETVFENLWLKKNPSSCEPPLIAASTAVSVAFKQSSRVPENGG